MKLKNFDLSNRVALITGSAGMLGIQHAAALLECGAKVILTDVNELALEEGYKYLSNFHDDQKIVIKCMDVSNQAKVIEVFNQLKSSNIEIDILVNNAAIDPKVKNDGSGFEASRLEDFSIEDWDFQLAIGLKGAFICSQVFGREMANRSTGGIILNIASDLSVIAPDQRLYRREGVADNMQPVKPITYSIIKSGLVGMTRYLATYWADRNVRCNALSPGGVFNGQSLDFVQRISSLIPMGRMARKDEYKSAIQFLCSDASIYLNGQNIVMDGGRSIW